MKLNSLYITAAAALLAFSSATFAQTQSGSSIRSDSGMSGSASGKAAAGTCDHLAGAERARCLSDSASGGASGAASPGGMSAPSTGTSADTAGAAGTTAPRSSDTTTSSGTTSVGTSGASSGASAPVRSSGLCDTLIGDERMKCLKEQAATGTTR